MIVIIRHIIIIIVYGPENVVYSTIVQYAPVTSYWNTTIKPNGC